MAAGGAPILTTNARSAADTDQSSPITDGNQPLCQTQQQKFRVLPEETADGLGTIDEQLKDYPPLTHLGMDKGREFIPHALEQWCAESGCKTGHLRTCKPWESLDVE